MGYRTEDSAKFMLDLSRRTLWVVDSIGPEGGIRFPSAPILLEKRYFLFWRVVVAAPLHPLLPSPSVYNNGETVRFQLEPWGCRVRNVRVQSAPWRILGQCVGLPGLEYTFGHIRPENDYALSRSPVGTQLRAPRLEKWFLPVSERTSPKAPDQSESSAGPLSRTELTNASQRKGRN
jgi:hypothetical protein